MLRAIFWQQIILLHAETNQPWPNKNIFYDCMWFSEQSPCLWHENRDKILNDREEKDKTAYFLYRKALK